MSCPRRSRYRYSLPGLPAAPDVSKFVSATANGSLPESFDEAKARRAVEVSDRVIAELDELKDEVQDFLIDIESRREAYVKCSQAHRDTLSLFLRLRPDPEYQGGDNSKDQSKTREKLKKDKSILSSKRPTDPESVKVRQWRLELQKAFLCPKCPPKEYIMQEIDALFTTLEGYHGMTHEQYSCSKMNKVLRHIAALPGDKVPRDAEFRFRARSRALTEKWHAQFAQVGASLTSPPVVSEGPGDGMPEKNEKKDGSDEDYEIVDSMERVDLENGTIGSPGTTMFRNLPASVLPKLRPVPSYPSHWYFEAGFASHSFSSYYIEKVPAKIGLDLYGTFPTVGLLRPELTSTTYANPPVSGTGTTAAYQRRLVGSSTTCGPPTPAVAETVFSPFQFALAPAFAPLELEPTHHFKPPPTPTPLKAFDFSLATSSGPRTRSTASNNFAVTSSSCLRVEATAAAGVEKPS
ncbi:unnamed protein product [Cyclocybe aegerita]|uniref:Uncharacterized protein n=1 Tax=Cyclocybe aegerita TaxID=1973307 RepID=A0A8S0X8C0_CYCAE|nr:unnamed protein product [Cyclocybe aegerita]